MVLKVKNGFCEKQFLNASGQLVARIRNLNLFGSEKVIMGSDITPLYETGIKNFPDKAAGENRCYTLKQKERVIATALPIYAAGADHYSLPRPPRPIGLAIQMQEGEEWIVERKENNSLSVLSPDGTGYIADFFAVRIHNYTIPDRSDVFLWVAIYALLGYMMHEDDIYIV